MASEEGVKLDHDQRFKEILREFHAELLRLFLKRLAKRQQGALRWERQEVFTNPPLGQVRHVDLLGVVEERIAGKIRERLLNVEVESAASLTEVRKKLGAYYPILRRTHNLPVTCLAVYLRVGLKGKGWDQYVEREPDMDAERKPAATDASPSPQPPGKKKAKKGVVVYRVRWRYVGLPALPAEEYLDSDNWLAVALSALMKIEPKRKPWLRAEILRRLAVECQENDYRKLLLINCAETYLPLEGEQEAEYQRLLREQPQYQEANKMILNTYDRLKAEGRAEGERKALREVIIEMASPQCGAPDESVLARLQQIEDLARLKALVRSAATAQSWAQLLAAQ